MESDHILSDLAPFPDRAADGSSYQKGGSIPAFEEFIKSGGRNNE